MDGQKKMGEEEKNKVVKSFLCDELLEKGKRRKILDGKILKGNVNGLKCFCEFKFVV